MKGRSVEEILWNFSRKILDDYDNWLNNRHRPEDKKIINSTKSQLRALLREAKEELEKEQWRVVGSLHPDSEEYSVQYTRANIMGAILSDYDKKIKEVFK